MRPGTGRNRASVAILAAVSTLLSLGCNEADPMLGFCAAPRPLALVIDVTDSITGLSLADSASGTWQMDLLTDTLFHSQPVPGQLMGGTQLGTYQVTVRRAGYLDWNQQGIVVSQVGKCGNVLPVTLDAKLQPAP